MIYHSTRDISREVAASEAITRGISPEGGLFVPKALPKIDGQRLAALSKMTYIERAVNILAEFLPEFSGEELRAGVEAAYTGKFGGESSGVVTPISRLDEKTYVLELWHGPTCAFKDMALQLLPHLLTLSAERFAGGKQIAILTATSGDTGKAALEGFKDVPGTRIMVFYPKDGVSEMQRLQMITQEGANVAVCGVDGNFDDAQTAVKRIFTDTELGKRLEKNNMMFSSANSINWGRLVPQICYYVSAYCDLVAQGELKPGEKLNVCVPTGNFGNILAAYYARHMGLPVNKLICASNINNVLTDFIRTGVYDRRREFMTTSSPSMDILISSNLERLLFELLDKDDAAVRGLMERLAKEGVYDVGEAAAKKLAAEFYAGCCDEAETAATIKAAFDEYSYMCDTHTAVGLCVARRYAKETGDTTKTLVASTASPYKFPSSILRALTGEASNLDEFRQAERLAELTNTEPPESLRDLERKPVRFAENRGREELREYVTEQLGI